MQYRSDDWRYNISKKIIANIRTKNAKISHNTSGIADGGIHFDWYFPNLYLNENVPNDVSQFGIIYDKILLDYLLFNSDYRGSYLGLTDKYFYSIGIDFRRQDASRDNVNYALAQGYKVRLNKIIESYKICMWWCDNYIKGTHDKASPDLQNIGDFYTKLKERYRRIYCAFKKDSSKFDQISPRVDSYGLYSLANCFEDGYEYKLCDDHIKKAIQTRRIYQQVFGNDQAPHKLIEREIAREAQLRQEAVLAPPPPPRPAPAPPPAPRRPAPARSVSADTLMRIRVIPDQPPIAKEEERKNRLNGALYGQAIFDALGLTTEFLSRNQAKTFLTTAIVTNGDQAIPATIIKPILTKQFNGENNFWHDHRKSDGYRRGNDYLVLNENIADPQGNVNINAVQNAMAKVISDCQTQLGMTEDEVMRAITLAKKYGGLGNVADRKLLSDRLLTDVTYDQDPQAMLNKFRKFSSSVQKLNERNRIYSGRKDGKLVGLRLTFVSEDAIRIWQENIPKIQSRSGEAAGEGPSGRAGRPGR